MTENQENINQPAPEESAEKKIKKRKRKRSWGLRILLYSGRIVLALMILFALLAGIVQLPIVQNWLVHKTTTYLTKELNTKVTISDLRIDFLDEISIGNLYVANQNTTDDTLAHIGRLRVDISYPHLLFGIVQLDAIRLENTDVRLRRDVGNYDFNYQFIINYFNPPKDGPKVKKPTPDIRVGQLHFRNIKFSQDDKVRGQLLNSFLKAADIHTNIMNLPNQLLDITRINLYEPFFQISDYQGVPLPPKPPVKLTTASQTQPQINTPPAKEKPFQFLIGSISIDKGRFMLDKWNRPDLKPLPDSLLDYRHLSVHDINLHIHNFFYSKDEFTGVVDGISLKDKSGFVLNKLIVGDVKVNSKEAALYGLQIETPYSALGDTVRFIYPEGYSSFKNFEDKVILDARLHGSKVLINDIMTFAPKLENNKFFVQNRYANARIEAVAFGKINSLKLPRFDIQLGDGFRAEGKFASRDLTNNSETYIDLSLNQLKTTIPSVKNLIPGFKIPNDFDKLGKLDFKGNFVGFFNNFTANGVLGTELGSAAMDVTVEPLSRDSSIATYSGNIALQNFDIGTFTKNQDLGKVTLKTSIGKGRGFRKDNVNLNLTAVVDSFQFKNYDYRNINLTGDLNRNLFSGKLESKDPNADFVFDGTINFESQIPVFKFKSDVKKFDLHKLNLAKQDLALAGKIDLDLTGNKLSNFNGYVNLKNILITKNQEEKYPIDSVSISALASTEGVKKYEISSEMLTANMSGAFNIEDVPAAIVNHFVKYHPLIANDLGLKLKPNILPQDFKLFLKINDTKTLTQLFDKKLSALKNIDVEAALHDADNSFNWSIETPETHYYDNVKIVEFGSIGNSKETDIDWDLKTYNVVIGGKQDFKDLIFQNHVTGDTIEFGFTSHNFSQSLRMDTVELNALLMRQDSTYKLSFGTNLLSRLKVFGDYWDISQTNFILFNKNFLEIKDFDLIHNERRITLQSIGNKGLSAELQNFDVSYLNNYITDSRIKMQGKSKVTASFEDIFKQKKFCGEVLIDSFVLKDEHRGKLHIDVSAEDFKSPIHAVVDLSRFNIQNQKEQLYAYGYYYPTARDTFKANSLDANVSLFRFPLRTLTILIENGASDFVGRIDGGMRASGEIAKLNLDGALRVRDGAVTVDYLKNRIYVRDGTVKIDNTKFDATGQYVYDSLGHKARLTGGLTHNRFKDFGLNLNIKADTFLCINTKREDNPLYYGYGIGKGDITFTGDFKRTDLKMDLTSGRGTRITFPFGTDQTASETNFVVFKTLKVTEGVDTIKKINELSGINLDMHLKVNDQADITLVFDETAGDNIRSRGNGDINFSVTRTGDMKMTGEYQILKGDYLFTLLRVVNKNFTLKPGGTIRWNGSPYNAVINVDAEYKNLSAPPYNFIAEIVDRDVTNKTESFKPTPIDLSLKLTGSLYKPDINFDMSFPRLNPTLKNYAENQLRILRQDQNELNRQVFGLVVVGSFLPSGNASILGDNQLRSGSLNTIYESAGSVLSSMFNRLLKEYVKGLDVEIGASVYSDNSTSGGRTGQIYRLRGNYQVNDRVSVSGGLGVETTDLTGAPTGNNVFIGGDVLVDYYITDDRRLKLRISSTYDQTLIGQRLKPAVGIRYRQEFDSVDEFIKNFKLKKPDDKNKIQGNE